MKILFVLLSLLIVTSCKPQQNKDHAMEDNQMILKVSQYFKGSWKFVEKNYGPSSEKKSYPLHECMKLYTWNFEFENDQYFLTKNFATGPNCEIKSSSKKYSVTINEGSINYFSGDLKKIEKFKIVSNNRFSIVSKDIINGSVQEIEDVYERL